MMPKHGIMSMGKMYSELFGIQMRKDDSAMYIKEMSK